MPILDDRKSLLIAFLVISDQYTTFNFGNFVHIMTSAAILDDRKSLSIAFFTISDQYAINFFFKMAASGHFKSGFFPKSIQTWTPHPPPHAKACASHNCDTNVHIKFIFDTTIDDLEWKNPIDLGDNRKKQNGRRRPFCEYIIEGDQNHNIPKIFNFGDIISSCSNMLLDTIFFCSFIFSSLDEVCRGISDLLSGHYLPTNHRCSQS